MPPTHALFDGDVFRTEVTPDQLNSYPVTSLVALPADYWTEGRFWLWQKRSPIEDAARVEAYLVDLVKGEAERRKMLVRTRGGAKNSEEYREKREEALASATLTAAVLNGLTRPVALARYPAAAMEAQLTGEPISAVLDEYRGNATPKNLEVLRLAAIERAGCKKIRAAATAPAKRVAFAAINWAWQPA